HSTLHPPLPSFPTRRSSDLTAVEPLEGKGEKTGTPDEIRAFVRMQKQAGADLIKIFASASVRQGGGMTLSQDQLNAACDEANKRSEEHTSELQSRFDLVCRL